MDIKKYYKLLRENRIEDEKLTGKKFSKQWSKLDSNRTLRRKAKNKLKNNNGKEYFE